MAISFSNIVYDKIINNLATLLNNEFNINVFYDEHKGNQSFLITPLSDTLEGYLSSGNERSYEIEIEYSLKIGGQYTKNNFKQISNIMERVKRLIFNNKSYSNGDAWFDGQISNIDYIREEDDLTILKAKAIFNCTNIEII
tara:strand:+ start:387 stop:809 length:423 start_codon:yes stop_codon:yes gene_type:complete